ncbi:MAG TPA: DUF2891 domain-containing protein [Ferrovibrio sp.]|uniref:DUF2891 domain-containing protein n=1 Tax=Ferrovibrio sp. TaxID=1917215 RepID=UPI002B4B03A4|nr:DUF2891 domain-containing protein [Ferrovibrio sp.]HLT76141.1 DUF2891 domain-containing protein [Ferrovibrio sp.]
MTFTRLTRAQAERFAALPLRNLTREYPNSLAHFLNGPEDVQPPHLLHPIFYGSYDWHSCVHGWWLLTRCLRRHPDLAQAAEAEGLYENHFRPESGEAEAAYLDAPGRQTWQRPYGWGWLLMLSAELEQWQHPQASRWRAALGPLEERITARFPAYMDRLTYPIRVGTHFNTAFGLLLALHYAHVMRDDRLAAAIAAYARRVFGADTDYPARYEPNGDDFLSGALVEALLMARLLPAGDFTHWWRAFLPEPDVFRPAIVADRADAKGVHLDGLNLSRAWCLRGIAACLPEAERLPLLNIAAAHETASLPFLESGHYGGEHWLATYAALAVEGLDG